MRKLLNRFCSIVVWIAFWSLLQCNAYSQNTNAQPPSKPSYLLAMTEYEGEGNRADWSFLSARGWKAYARWRDGEEAILELESPEKGKVVVNRTDVNGARQGLTATYEGTLDDDGQMGGTYSYSYLGKSGSGHWYAILGMSMPELPKVMRFCDVNCFTLYLQNDRTYTGSNGNEHWTVESFTRDSAIFHRKVVNPSFGVTYQGKISEDGYSLVGVANPFCCRGGQPADISLAWGLALNTVRGNDAEGNAKASSPNDQISLEDVYNAAKSVRDTVIEIHKWPEAWNILFPPRGNQ